MTLDEINNSINDMQADLGNLQSQRTDILSEITRLEGRIQAWWNTPNPMNPEPVQKRAYYASLKAAQEELLGEVQEHIEVLEAQIQNVMDLQGTYIEASAEAASMGLTGEAAEVYAQGKLSEEKKAGRLKIALMVGGAILLAVVVYYLIKKARKIK